MRLSFLFLVGVLIGVFAIEAIFPVEKPQIVDPIQGDTKAPDMIENQLHVERFGPVHKTVNHADGTHTEEEYWEAKIHDDRNRHVYFVHCLPEEEARWRAFAEWEKKMRLLELATWEKK